MNAVGLLCRALLIVGVSTGGLGMAILSITLGGIYGIVGIVMVFALVMRRRRQAQASITHGSADFAAPQALVKSGHLGATHGLVLGRLPQGSDNRLPGRLLLTNPINHSWETVVTFIPGRNRRLGGLVRERDDAVNGAYFAPPGAGKSTAYAIPFALNWQGSCVIVDFKGELHERTADYRKTVLGQRIVTLDPFGVRGGTDTLNPLSHLNARDFNVVDECRFIADSLVVRTGKESENHWLDSATDIITGVLSMIVSLDRPETKTLTFFREVMSDKAGILGCAQRMVESNAYGGAIRQLGNRILSLEERERSSIFSTIHTQTGFIDSPVVAEHLRQGTFNASDLLKGNVTVYLILPSNYVQSHARLMRTWLTTLLRSIYSHGPQEKHNTLFLIDEAAQLGPLPVLEQALVLMRGYGVRCRLFYQSIGQIEDSFPENKAKTFLASCDTQVYFGTNDYDTAKTISDRIGMTTVNAHSRNWGSNRGGNSSVSESVQGGSTSSGGSWGYSNGGSVNEVSRALMTPDEILALPRDMCIAFTKGCPRPMLLKLVRWYNDPHYQRLLGNGRRAKRFINAFKAVMMTIASCMACIGGLGFGLIAYHINYVEPKPSPTITLPVPINMNHPQSPERNHHGR